MKTILATLALVIFTATVSFAFDTGTWKGKNGDIQGEIKITKSGTGYLADVNIFQPSRPNFDEGYCLFSAQAKDTNGNLQVYSEGKLGYTIQKEGKGLKVTLVKNAELPICGDHPSFDNVDIIKMKWKKVK